MHWTGVCIPARNGQGVCVSQHAMGQRGLYASGSRGGGACLWVWGCLPFGPGGCIPLHGRHPHGHPLGSHPSRQTAPSPCRHHPLGRPQGRHPLPLGRHLLLADTPTPLRRQPCSGQYPSYRNAFLLKIKMVVTVALTKNFVCFAHVKNFVKFYPNNVWDSVIPQFPNFP